MDRPETGNPAAGVLLKSNLLMSQPNEPTQMPPLVINGQIVQAEQRLAVPVAENLRDLAAVFVPAGRATGR